MRIEIARRDLQARRTLLMAAALVAGCCVLRAQPDGPGGPPPYGPLPRDMQQQQLNPGPSVERQLKQLTQLLTLTSAQQTQAKAILTDQHQQMEALISQSRETRKESRNSTDATASENQPPDFEAMEKSLAAARAIREEANAKITAALTDDQKTRFAAWEKNQARESAQQERDDMPPPPAPDGGDGPPPGDGGGAPGGEGPPGV